MQLSASKCKQVQASATKCNQVQPIATKFNQVHNYASIQGLQQHNYTGTGVKKYTRKQVYNYTSTHNNYANT